MGFKGWLTVGAGLVACVVLAIRRLQEESRSEAKVNRIIREVDCGETEEEPKAVDQMSDEIEKAFREMGLDEEAEAYIGAAEALNGAVRKDIEETEEELPKFSEEAVKKIEERYEELCKEKPYLKRLDSNFEKIREERELENIRKAIESQNFSRMYELFEQRYNKYPVEMSRAEAFGKAADEGLISKDILREAQERYGKLWCYVGD